MDAQPRQSIRERTRRIAQQELTVVAQDLFLEHGYEGTTVDQIAEAAGMSKRTFFRYFASKDDLVIGKYDLLGDRLAEALSERPADEPMWTSMRAVLETAVDYIQDPRERDRNAAMELIVQSTPSLQARYLERMQRVQSLLVDGLRAKTGDPAVAEDPVPAAVVGAAFACMSAARAAWLASDQQQPFTEVLDATMAAFTVA